MKVGIYFESQTNPQFTNSIAGIKFGKVIYREVLGIEVTEWWVIRDGFTGLGIKL